MATATFHRRYLTATKMDGWKMNLIFPLLEDEFDLSFFMIPFKRGDSSIFRMLKFKLIPQTVWLTLGVLTVLVKGGV